MFLEYLYVHMQRTYLEVRLSDPSPQAIPAYVSIRQHTSAYVSNNLEVRRQTPLRKYLEIPVRANYDGIKVCVRRS